MNALAQNPDDQISCLVNNNSFPIPLCASLEDLSNSLLIANEVYLRNFKSERIIPFLISVIQKGLVEFCHGDVLTMAFRTLSLILEFVPSSYSLSHEHSMSMLKLTSQAIHQLSSMDGFFIKYTSDVLMEECLRVIRFVGKAERSGRSLSVDYVDDLLHLCESKNALVARQGLETLLTLCSKMIVPPDTGKVSGSVFFGIFPSSKADEWDIGNARKKDLNSCKNPIVVKVETVLGPFLLGVINKSCTEDLLHEMWTLFELALQCLGTLIERALLCHRPSTARAITYDSVPTLVFKAMSDTNQNVALSINVRSERILLCETFLTIVASSNRMLLAKVLLEPDSKTFYASLFECTEFSIASILEDPFTKFGEGGTHKPVYRDKDNVTTMNAIYLFICALPQIPLEAFGWRPKIALPVHRWMWEDEMRHVNRISESHCVTLELDYFRLSRVTLITIHGRVYPADLYQMTLYRSTEKDYRNITRSFTPFVYRYVDEKLLRPIAEGVKEPGPQRLAPPQKSIFDFLGCAERGKKHGIPERKKGRDRAPKKVSDNLDTSMDHFDNLSLSQIRGKKEGDFSESSYTIPEQYLVSFCQYTTHAAGQMVKELAIWACAAMLRMCLLSDSNHLSLENFFDANMMLLCHTLQTLFSQVSKTSMALMLSMIEWLLYRPTAAPLSFCKACLRTGLLAQLSAFDSLSVILPVDAKFSSKETLSQRSSALHTEITTRLQRYFRGLGGPELLDKRLAEEFVLKMPEVVALRDALNALKEITTSTVQNFASTSNFVDVLDSARASLPPREKEALYSFFLALHDSTHLTSYELQKLDLASVILPYLLDNKTTDDLFGEEFVYLSGASGSTSITTLIDSVPELPTLLAKQQLQWITMANRDTHLASLLHLHSHQPRLECFLGYARQMPEASELLVRYLVRSLSFENDLPLEESILFSGSVTSALPGYAFQVLSRISPRVALCAAPSKTILSRSPEGSKIKKIMKRSLLSAGAVPDASDNDQPERPKGSDTLIHTKATHSPLCEASDTTHGGANRYDTRNLTSDHFMSTRSPVLVPIRPPGGESLKTVDTPRPFNANYPQQPSLNSKNSFSCETEKVGKKSPNSLSSKSFKDRVHLFASVGDIERFFRLGTTSVKGMQTGPGLPCTLNLEKLATRAETILRRRLAANPAKKELLEVAKLLISNRAMMVTQLEKLIASLQIPRPSNAQSPLVPLKKLKEEDLAATTLPTPPDLPVVQSNVAADLLRESIEERYILYFPFMCGPCPLQSTFLSHLYHQCVVTANKEGLFQLESGLLRLNSTENGLMGKLPSAPAKCSRVAQRSLSTGERAAAAATITDTSTTVDATLPQHTSSTKMSNEAEQPPQQEFFAGQIAPNQVFAFHRFDTDSDTKCCCGMYSRVDFASVKANTPTQCPPKLVRCAALLLLIHLHSRFRSFDTTKGNEASQVLWARLSQSNAFASAALTSAVVNSLKASALRVSLLPPRYALPRWLNFVLNHAYFLLPRQVRNDVARFLAFGARRSLTKHMQTLQYSRLASSGILLPGEWAKIPNHKFTVDRSRLLQDAFAVLQKSSDLRLPMSIEFLDDLGVGQGPTAQFYTLLAKELCKEQLCLWRGTEPQARQKEQPQSRNPFIFTKKLLLKSMDVISSKKTTRYASALSNSGTHQMKKGGSSAMLCMSTGQDKTFVTIPQEGLFPSAYCFDRAALKPYYVSFSQKPPLFGISALKASANHTKMRLQKAISFSKNSALIGRDPASQWSGSSSMPDESRTILVHPHAVLCDYVQHQRESAKAFYVVGAALAKAFMDHQVFPLSLCPALALFVRRELIPYRVTLQWGFDLDGSSRTPVDLLQLPSRVVGLLDKGVFRTLEMLERMDSETLESLEIPFTLPGDDSFELVPGGSELKVTKKNLLNYKRRVVSTLIYDTVQVPLRLFMIGFSDVLPPSALCVLEEEELMMLLCGADRQQNEPLWNEDEISSVLVGDHGYKNNSPQLKMLAHILAHRLTPEQQRGFLQFCTGCPLLPLGGVSALGAITVVKSSTAFSNANELGGLAYGSLFDRQEDHTEPSTFLRQSDELDLAAETTDEGDKNISASSTSAMFCRAMDSSITENANTLEEEPYLDTDWPLPSVNTCFRYLKLPPYPNEQLMFKKLLYSITHGGDTFELS